MLRHRRLRLLPFGRDAVDREDLTRRGDLGTGTLGFLGNVIWFVVVGVWLAIGHLVSALACFVTIIGIPFGLQHLKLAVLTLAPVGKTIVDKEVAAAVRGEAAQDALNKYRS